MDHIARILCVLYESLGLLEQDRKVEWDLLSELWHISMQGIMYICMYAALFQLFSCQRRKLLTSYLCSFVFKS